VRRSRLTLAVAFGLALLAVLGLLAAGAQHMGVRTASADTPNQVAMPPMRPAETACEGPLTSDGPARSVGIWGTSGAGGADLTLKVQDAATRGVLASGALRATPGDEERVARLRSEAPGGRPLRICVTDDAGTFSLTGSSAGAPGLGVTGLPPGQKFALVLLSAGNRSLLGSLSTAFGRASLWRPSWVGPWTFWVLALALLAAFGVGAFAVLQAAGDEPAPPGRRPPPEDPAPPDPHAPSRATRSEAGQDRPQPVS
jgi:hypothetical protein